jgi:hypothetical protein
MVATEKGKVLETKVNAVCNIWHILRDVHVELDEHKF